MTHFKSYTPSPHLQFLVESYWTVEDAENAVHTQKILPDGFPEIIFHFADPYRININGQWMVQQKSLLAGQLTKFFFLENTGRAEILGIKLKPTALSRLAKLDMHVFNDRVVELLTELPAWEPLDKEVRQRGSLPDRIAQVEQFLTTAARPSAPTATEKAVARIFDSRGMITVGELAKDVSLTERQVEHLFRKNVGLSPKLYARIVRFNHVFRLLNDKEPDWMALVAEAGYYDQSHFIHNFKAFAGEDPSSYGFTEKTMANFFLQKQ